MNHNKKKGITTMKKKNLIMIATSTVFLLSTLFGKEVSNAGDQRVARVAEGLENSSPSISVMNINNLAYWISKDGAYTTSGSPNGEQADYPIFTGGLIYADGMLWGAKVKGDGQGDGVRVGGSTYYHGLKAGRVITAADGSVLGSDDPANNHVWRVRKDWENGDLTVDAANYYGYTSASDVTAEQIAAVKSQYEYDWNNWPTAWGAPYEDVNMNGSYDAGTDIPGYPKADQTMWTVANDVPKVVNEAGDSLDYQSTAPNLYGADPIGIELQITLWGYAFGAGDPLGNMIFKKATMKYMGLPDTPAGARMDSLYFTQWSDPDLGTYTDDYVGCDIDLSFGYVYNGNRLDGVYNGIHNLPVPAGGYDFLQGPPDTDDIDMDGDTTEYLGMTSFTYFGAGSSISDPDLASYAGSLQFFNLMEGFLPRPEYPTQIPWTDPATGETTKFALSGDPVAGSGWIDGVQLPPGDRRLVMASGPFTMKLGESADVVLGIVGGMGLDNVSSVSVAKFHDQYAQYAYDQNFSLPSAPTSPSLSGIEMDGKIGIDWGSSSSAVSSTEETVSAGFEFEGYVVYQLPSSSSPLSEGVKVATYDKVNLILNILDPTVDPLTGLVVDAAKQTGTDGGVQRYFETDYDEVRGRPLSNGITYHFGVTAYSFLPANEGSPFKTLESGESRISITPHDANPGVMVYSEMSSDIEVTHSGTANAFANVTVVNPGELKNESYKVTFDSQTYARDIAGVWNPVSGRSAASTADATDCSGSTITATAFASASLGTIDLVLDFALVCPGGAWIDGMKMTFPAGFAAKVNSYAITGGGNVCSYGTDSGQNCDNLDGTWDGEELLYGNFERTGFGAFESSNTFTVNYTPTDPVSWDLPLEVAFVIYDDAYDGTTIDGEGTTTAATQNFEQKTENHWNLSTASGAVLLEDQTFVGGQDIYGGASVGNNSNLHYNIAAAVTVDGFQVNVDGGYAAPTDVFGHTYEYDEANAALYGASSYDIDSYAQNGWALTAKAVDTYGNGITSVSILQRDIMVDFCGEFVDEPITVNDVVYYGADLSLPHSYAWISGSRVGAFTDHPAPGGDGNPNDNSGAPFRIAVPFKVYDMEAEGGPVQIDIDLYDRLQSYSAGDTVYAFNPYNRMYTHFIHHAYLEGGQYVDGPSGVPSDFFTWNVVWWDTQFNMGDKVTFNYANPIQAGLDEFSWTTKASTTATSNDVSSVSVYPNPYYGTHEVESSRADKYVSFNHLPAEATIDIYSLGGVFVRTIDKNDATSQFTQWDLKNQYGYPVASGMYVARVKSGGEEKILKIALVQETQVLKYY
jgi:hypothetical protein